MHGAGGSLAPLAEVRPGDHRGRLSGTWYARSWAIVAVGLGRIGPNEVFAALEADGARPRAGNAPPQGLFLWAVEY